MPIEIKMPALSPTMDEGTLAKWLVKVGDTVSSGDILAEIETDKATMEFEAVDEGVIASIAVAEGSEGVKVGTVIATIAAEGEDPAASPCQAATPVLSSTLAATLIAEPAAHAPLASGSSASASPLAKRIAAEHGIDLETLQGTGANGFISRADVELAAGVAQLPALSTAERPADAAATKPNAEDRIIASPLARRIAAERGIDLAGIAGSGPGGRIIRDDVEEFQPASAAGSESSKSTPTPPTKSATSPDSSPDFGIPFEAEKLNNVRKTIARRLTEAKQTIPHIYLTVDIRLDALLELRAELNKALEADGVKLSVNDLMIKALGKALLRVPKCNVSFAGDELHKYTRADISVAVAAPSGLITPIIVDAAKKGVAQISIEMKTLVDKAREGRLKPHEFQGGTASLSNLGMFGIKQFEAVINPPQAMIMAIGAGEQRPYLIDGALGVAMVMSATGSFDHRAIDGADGAQMMQAFKDLIESPLGLLA